MNLLNEYLEKRQEGMDYSEMYNELGALGYEKTYIKDLINEIDSKYLLLLEQKNNRSFSNILNGSIRFILGIGLLSICFLYIIAIVYNGISPGFIVIAIISLSFTAGSVFFVSGKKALKKASKKKVKIEKNNDLLD
jgi:hypothetical protein